MRSSAAPQLKGMVLDADALSQANAAPQLSGMVLDPDDQGSFPTNSPSSFLRNIGGELESFANDSSGLGGLFLPWLAQSMINNPTPTVQNQLTMNMAYPPALLQKMMAAEGGIPSVSAQNNMISQQAMGNQMGGIVAPYDAPGFDVGRDIVGALGKIGQSALKTAAYPGLSGLGINSKIRNSVSSIANAPINKELGIPENSGNQFAENALGQAMVLPGDLKLLGGAKDLLSYGAGKLVPSLNKGGSIGSLLNEWVNAHSSAQLEGQRLYGAKDIYNSSVPDNATSLPLKITKNLKLSDGTSFSPDNLNLIKKTDPDYFDSLIPSIRKNEGQISPLRQFMGKDYDLVKNESGGANVLKRAEENYNVGGLHSLSKDINQMAVDSKFSTVRNPLFKLSQRIRDELVKPTLGREDALNGTNVLSDYEKADLFHANVVAPFEANNTLAKYSNGSILPEDTSRKELSSVLKNARQEINPYKNRQTGLKNSVIPQGHILREFEKRLTPSKAQKFAKYAVNIGGPLTGLDILKKYLP